MTVSKYAEAQYAMKGEEDLLVFFYNEAMVQFGFVVLFSQVFTLAPLFSVFTNLLEIKIKLDGIGKYSRRMGSEGARGIGAWMGVMEVMSFIAIPVNIAIIVFTKKSRVYDQDGVETSKSSAWIQSMTPKAGETSFWNEYTIILFAFLIEHIMMLAKSAIGLLITDVPTEVVKAEAMRDLQKKEAHEYLEDRELESKKDGSHFESFLTESKREAAEQRAHIANMLKDGFAKRDKMTGEIR